MFYNDIVSEMTSQLYGSLHQSGRVIKARQFIDRHFTQSLSLAVIAKAVFSSAFHLNREFKRFYGITPLQYLQSKRIAEAKKALIAGCSVSAACFGSGYESLGSFSILFRRMTGKNPIEVKTARIKK